MTIDNAMQILIAHRNNWQVYDYQERKAAFAAIKHLVTEWIQQVDGNWQLVVIGYH